MLGEAPKLLKRLKKEEPGWQRERMVALKLAKADYPSGVKDPGPPLNEGGICLQIEG